MKFTPRVVTSLACATWIAVLPANAVSQTSAISPPDDFAERAQEIAQSYHDADLFDGVVIVATASEILYRHVKTTGLAPWMRVYPLAIR